MAKQYSVEGLPEVSGCDNNGRQWRFGLVDVTVMQLVGLCGSRDVCCYLLRGKGDRSRPKEQVKKNALHMPLPLRKKKEEVGR